VVDCSLELLHRIRVVPERLLPIPVLQVDAHVLRQRDSRQHRGMPARVEQRDHVECCPPELILGVGVYVFALREKPDDPLLPVFHRRDQRCIAITVPDALVRPLYLHDIFNSNDLPRLHARVEGLKLIVASVTVYIDIVNVHCQ
jgi:hypothetical protein